MSRRRKKGGERKGHKDVVWAGDNPRHGKVQQSSIVLGEVGFGEQESVVHRSEFFAGPLPPPDVLKEYDAILEGAAERIIQNSEKQAKHRRTLESDVVGTNLKMESRGQLLAFVVVMTAVIGGMVLIALDKQISGLAAFISAVGGTAGLFMWAKRQKIREMEDKSVPITADPPTASPALPKGPGYSPSDT